ncbi:MAG: porin family protein, partial [Gammaproteobacteria bacterium]|nr:porin family protein [Gammaproteobacteria bacterium]
QTRDIMNKFAFLFSASLFLASTAHAEGFYAGGSVGFGDATLRSDDQFDDPDDTLFVAKGIGGYRVNEFFAVEGTIIGATNDEYDDGFDGEADVSFGALTGSLLGIIPVAETFELYAKVGGYFGESEVQDDFFFFGNNRDEDESGLVWGAGTFISFGSRKQFTIRVDYEAFDTDALDDFWMVTGGFQYNF